MKAARSLAPRMAAEALPARSASPVARSGDVAEASGARALPMLSRDPRTCRLRGI